MDLKNGVEQSRIASAMYTVSTFCCPECQTVNLIELQSLQTCENSEQKILSLSLILSSGDFHAKTCPALENKKEFTQIAQDYLARLQGSQMKLNLGMYSLKMSQQLEQTDLNKWSGHLPAWGMYANGRLSQPENLEPRTLEKGGFCLPTPTVFGNYNKKGASKNSGNGLATFVKMFPTPTARDSRKMCQGDLRRKSPSLGTIAVGTGGTLSPMWVEWLMGFPLMWTELNHSEMLACQSKRKQRLKD